jgi:hypothetical protein
MVCIYSLHSCLYTQPTQLFVHTAYTSVCTYSLSSCLYIQPTQLFVHTAYAAVCTYSLHRCLYIQPTELFVHTAYAAVCTYSLCSCLYIQPTQLYHFIKLLCNENAEKEIWEWWLRRVTDVYYVHVLMQRLMPCFRKS